MIIPRPSIINRVIAPASSPVSVGDVRRHVVRLRSVVVPIVSDVVPPDMLPVPEYVPDLRIYRSLEPYRR